MIDGRDDDAMNLQSLDKGYLEAKAVCVFISAFETGMIIMLFARFFVRKRERLAIRFLVYFVTFVALFQMATTFASLWRVSVLEYGNRAGVSDLQWPDKIYFTLSSFIAASVQLFYIWRCWHVSLHRQSYIAVFLVLLVIGSVATEVYVMVIGFLVDWNGGNVHLLAMDAFYTCSMLSLAFSVVVDFSVTGILLVFLSQSRSTIHTRRFRHTLFRLTLITWESAVPPCTCTIAALIVGTLSAPVISSWGIMLQTVLGKLYLISLFVTLEGRTTLAGPTIHTHFPTLTGASRNIEVLPIRPGGSNHADASKPPDLLPLEFKSDTCADESTFDP